MGKHVIRISEAEAAATNVATLLAGCALARKLSSKMTRVPSLFFMLRASSPHHLRVHRTASRRLGGYHRS